MSAAGTYMIAADHNSISNTTNIFSEDHIILVRHDPIDPCNVTISNILKFLAMKI